MFALTEQAPPGIEVEREMTIRLDERNRPEPGVLVTTAPYDPNRYWRVEEEDAAPVVHAYELDGPTRSYASVGIHRNALTSRTPFAIKLDLDRLVPGRTS